MRSLSFDAKKKTVKGKFKPSTSAERQFYKQIKKVAQASGHIVEQHVEGSKLQRPEEMKRALEAYSEKLTPWATRQAARMLETVQKSNQRAYSQKSKALGKVIQESELDVKALAYALLNEQVGLIKSIPLEAGERAQRIAFEAALEGTRAQVNEDTVLELQRQLGLSTEVAVSRAKLIAVTETARANAAINQARAMSVGSNQYRWHNSGDAAVRKSHKFYHGRPMQGQIFSWDKPPTLSDGMTGHPGTFPRCRCFAEPVFDDE